MTAGKPNNLARTLLRGVGIGLYKAGLASTIIGMRANRTRAMLYHAVENASDSFTYGLNVSVTPEMFAANLDYFKKHYNVVPMSSIECCDNPKRSLVITFDDGYHSVFEHAYPALVERNLSACIYLITRAVEGRLVWVNLLNYALREYPTQTKKVLSQFDNLSVEHGIEHIISTVQVSFGPARINALCDALLAELPGIDGRELYANEAEIRQMQADGLEFGFHTRDHFNLRNCNDMEIQEQLDSRGCDHLTNSNTFAYPFGYFNTRAVNQLESKAYKRVMTVGNNNDLFSKRHLDRTEVFSAKPAELFAQLEIVEPVVARLRRWMVKGADDARAYGTANARRIGQDPEGPEAANADASKN